VVPGFRPKSTPCSSIADAGAMPTNPGMYCQTADCSSRLNRTVCSSTTSMPSSPSRTLLSAQESGEPTSGFLSRSKLAFTSPAVTGSPLWNVASRSSYTYEASPSVSTFDASQFVSSGGSS